MEMNDTIRQFIKAHADADLDRLLFSADQYPEIDIPFAVEQIAVRRQIREKLPSWYANEQLIFPSKIAGEQCSSEQTACYKQRLLEGEELLCDLTGGLGVDTYFFSQQVRQVVYVERSQSCFDAAMHNFSVLKAGSIHGINGEAADVVAQLEPVDVFFIDPARRGLGDKRVFALSDCEPDLLSLLPQLLEKAPKVIAKLSPMLDIRHTLSLLPQTAEVHVISVKNECKELLFVLKRCVTEEPVIRCINYTTGGYEQLFSFRLSEEASCMPVFTDAIKDWLYEPSASVLKAGAYKQIACQLDLPKLHVSSHLYTSNQLLSDFPGRVFKVKTVYPFSGKLCKTINRQVPKANLTVRNFPLSVNELRKRTHIAEGGDVFMFATTLCNNQKVLVCCEKS